ncbi:PTS lactose/cellobiose transporter subunit IIA [Staphylococcus kloosii]|uniref:PTS mannose transporter subunit IIA n=2 Tax=Staphylococcus kloosii TaxID=29384 RepID=A0ABQ0XLL9_9STAP|nr:PTS lactose/cellobiose transporter subunit IIA [Staphylococcus kloosii]MBF7021122.1 PTS lactose/cellobiose transporter subunit IIA [Staphylococcus kloosii]MBF7030398.1 PTS lactose/cellobiose transporter subunit IIA [Staphylococcus kloosii]PNZ04779.1 PTS lactose/cellobiose transporter subunit IIA [Staphylococcus kloosii]PTJ79651.1 PTS lactose/cellobiose transporter subunit IIA [Staphylococcus kloosii]
MEENKMTEQAMSLIAFGGDAKSSAMEAIYAAKKGDFDNAEQKVAQAQQSLTEAHQIQTTMLTEEAQGHHHELTLLTVHSQDHLMTAIAFNDIAKEMIDLYKEVKGQN